MQTLLLLLSLLLLLPLWFLLSFLIVVLLLQLLSTNPVVSQFEHLRRLFFLISSLFSLLASLVASRPGKVRTLLQHSCGIDGAPHCLVLRRHSDPHPDVVLSCRNAAILHVCANPAAARLHHRWRATLLRPKATLRSSSRRGSLIQMLPHLFVLKILMSIQTWLCLLLSLKVQTML